MIIWIVIAVSVVVCLVLLYLDGRRRERAVLRDWELVLTPKGERTYRWMESRVHSDLLLANLTYTRAFSARDVGSVDEAHRLLDVGCKLIEQFAPTMLRSLAAMAVLSRMVAAMAPVRPLRPRKFRLRQLANLAYLNQFVHHFLVSTSERFRLRVTILGRGFALLSRIALRSTDRIRTGSPDGDSEWQQIEAVRKDLHTLSDESLETFRILLTSLAAERRLQG